jgi:hypothetical protein
MTARKVIKVATDYSTEPFGRYPQDGNSNGTDFREKWLKPALDSNELVTVDFDGAEGYGSSFLEESFGGLVRLCGFTATDLHKKLRLVSEDDPSIASEVWDYIDIAAPKN